MKILHINFSDRGGAAKAAMNLHYALLEKNVDSKFLALNLEGDYLEKDQIYSHRRVYKSIFRKLFYLYFSPFLLKYKNSEYTRSNIDSPEFLSSPFSNFDITLDPLYMEADIIHLHWTARFLDYPSFFKKNRKPIVWTLHDKNPFSGILHCETGFPIQFIQLEKKIIELKKQLFRKQNILVHSPSIEYMERSQSSELLGSFKHVHLPHIINEYFPIKNQSKDQLRKELNLPLGEKLVLVVADDLNRKLKGIREIVDLADSVESVKFVFVGKTLNFSDSSIIELGCINDPELLNKVYNAVDLTLSNSIEESYGLSLAESLSAGTPVIGRAIGGFKDFILPERNGVFICKKLTEKELIDSLGLKGELVDNCSILDYMVMYKEVLNHVS